MSTSIHQVETQIKTKNESAGRHIFDTGCRGKMSFSASTAALIYLCGIALYIVRKWETFFDLGGTKNTI